MAAEFTSACDDFYVNLRLGTHLPLPHERHTLLSLFEQLQKAYPSMTKFRRNEGECSMEEPRVDNRYRWVILDHHRLSAGHVNPPSVETAMTLHRFVLEQANYQLGVRPVEVEYVDILFGFDLEYRGDHAELIAEILVEPAPLACLLEAPQARPLAAAQSVTVALEEGTNLQARVDVVGRGGQFDADGPPEVISVYLAVRRLLGDKPRKLEPALLDELEGHCQRLASRYVMPRVLWPLRSAIESRS
jgi:hypothetical protein